jgi:hypothetical protein
MRRRHETSEVEPSSSRITIGGRPLRALVRALVAAAAVAAGAWPAGAAETTLNVYLQEAFPKQTTTNRQIADINEMLGTNFEDWGDIHNLSLGGQFLRRISDRWKLGVEVDYSQGEVSGEETVETLAGPARAEFEQRYSTFADLLAAAHWLPCPGCRKVEPFVLLAAGIAYEKDRTTLTLRNDFLDESLRVDHDGTYPVATAGIGIDIPLSARRSCFLQLGTAYFWGRLDDKAAAHGSLAPAPEVTADTDSTGPNYWLGLSWRLGSRQ